MGSRRVAAAAILLAALAAACTGSPPQEPDRSPTVAEPSPLASGPAPPEGAPNVLVILTDDQRLDTLGAMPRTMAWFRRGGVAFPQGYVTTPLCCPSRASILTGRYAHNHGVLGNTDGPLLDHRSTVQRHLHDAGYRTAVAGKFLNGWDVERDPPYFDRWAIFSRGYYAVPFNVNGVLRTPRAHSSAFIFDQAASFLREFERDDARPWLLLVAPYAPHEPWIPEPGHAEDPVAPWMPNPAVLEDRLDDKPPVVRGSTYTRDGRFDLGDVGEMRREQLRTLRSLDDHVDRLIRLLGDLGERRDTLAFFLSDNGFLWGEHGLAGLGQDTGKRFPYTPAVRVPFFMRWPGHLRPGTTDGRLVANVDLAPTILEAAGVRPDPAPPLDGRSLLGPSSREELLLEYVLDPTYTEVPSWASLRTAGFQYVEWYAEDGEVTFREYYDLAADPWQLENLLADGDPSNDPDVAALSERLARARACSGSRGAPACP